MRKLDQDLWVAETPLRFLGLEIGARMTVVRLPNSELMVHSPIRLSRDLLREVEALGRVAYLVAPNRLHHLFIEQWQEACEGAKTYLAPGLETKRPALEKAGLLGEEAETAWAETVDQVLLDGFPFANEVLFFHRPSSTLIATDLAFNFDAESPALTRHAFRLLGSRGGLAPTVLERLMVRDREAFRRSLERILDWPFQRVVVAHGAVCERGGREQLVRNYQWALASN